MNFCMDLSNDLGIYDLGNFAPLTARIASELNIRFTIKIIRKNKTKHFL